ncbi:MAG: TetR/AcrR family transcriptional regulator [Proteobacteria bacterium]|nr:TetR/AcrR family transcriptional regulator [Pseudomonadota bacterium]
MIKAAGATLQKNSSSEALPAKKARGGDAERRAAIMDCAEDIFLEEGFQAASMSAIAARLGGSKGTLYNYFESKDDLFVACVARHCEELHEAMSSLLVEGSDLRETLTEMGRRYVEFVSSDATVAKFRMVVAEADRVPDMARAFYETGPARGVARLSGYLERAMDQGRLRKADPARAAQHFLALCQNRLSKSRLCNYEAAPSKKLIARDVDEAVHIFLAGYAP